MIQLSKKILLRGTIILKTGMHIGGTFSAMDIGGPDSSVIRNPMDNIPFIPGSSLKGKMRALMEIADGTAGNRNMGVIKHGPANDPSTTSAQLFGNISKDHQIPSRIIVRDAPLITEGVNFDYTDLPYAESKTETTVDRVNSRAMPRQIERVPAGAMFSMEMILNVFKEEANQDSLIRNVLRGLALVKDDYLGGHGSRGYGRVVFDIQQLVSRPMEYYKNTAQETSILTDYQDLIDRLKD